MKPAKSPRPPPPQKHRHPRASEGSGKSASPLTTPTIESVQADQKKGLGLRSKDASRNLRSPVAQVQPISPTAHETQDLDMLRRRMSEALARKQERINVSKSTSDDEPSPKKAPSTSKATSNSTDATLSHEIIPDGTGAISADSTETVRPPFERTPGNVRTPSYPFPRIGMKLNRGLSQRSGPHHKPFTLLSPTSDPPNLSPLPSKKVPSRKTSSELSTPVGHDPSAHVLTDDPNYPTPDLYDMILMLNTEPGLESWWANATEILVEAYGAERASLALPGDITDLENVPWGQKATFCIYGSDSGDSTAFDSHVPSELDTRSIGPDAVSLGATTDTPIASKRPPLESRHSIAGVMPENASKGSRQRPKAAIRAISTLAGANKPSDDKERSPLSVRWTKQDATSQNEEVSVGDAYDVPQLRDPPSSATSVPRCLVHGSLHPLEEEPDALLVRTGVASLFGKRRPVILTRAYTENDGTTPDHEYESRLSQHPKKLVPLRREREGSASTTRAFDEYEQPEPSPWSQSPAPSPAARPDPSESPFFTQFATVDEEAFAKNPPVQDYGASANASLNAIGTDEAKTLVHVPLLQSVPSRKMLASGLRFPIAIVSFLTPVNPYPRNLRHSLNDFLPHLASTFALAQQYSALQSRLTGGSVRTGAAFGIGGTFSDEGSELELVNELSTQLQQERTVSKTSSLAGSFYSPSERFVPSRGSPSGSLAGTPYLEELGLSVDFPSTPGKSGSEIIDSYFSAKRNRSGILQGQKGGQTALQNLHTYTDDSPERTRKSEKGPPSSRGSLKKGAGTSGRLHSDSTLSPAKRSASLTSETSAAERVATSIRRTPSHRDFLKPDESERPLPELIAALMLNAVPLQLFLAKPTTGDLVWTNRKFDAFRSQGEGRVKDPWKNVHPADRPDLVGTWNDALKNGNQFTHYIRVKRFNSDSDFRWFVFRASTMLSNNGRLLYWVGSFLDIHDQYIKNLEAQEMEANMTRDVKLRALADVIPQVLFEAVEREGIVSVNQQWHTYSGQSLDEARGLGFARHVHRDDLHKCGMFSSVDISRSKSDSESSSTSSHQTSTPLQSQGKGLFAPDDSALATMIKEGSMMAERDENGRVSYTTEIRLCSKGGEYRWFLVRLVKVQNEILTKGHASWYGTCTDIETRMSLEKKLNEANKKVHSEMESKTKFFANMSHEIRTPLNGILGSMPWLVESVLDHDQRRTVDMIQNSANNLRELVDNILDVTKVEAGKMTLLPKWFHVRSLCEEVVDTCSSRAIERGLELNYTLDAEVPATVKGDPFRVRQVLLNLMGNSVKFTEQGEVYLRCTLRSLPRREAADTEAFLHFDVVDTGRGFNEVEFQRLFKQFGQIEGASVHDAGSGLGLFLSKQLVEMHGGELSVKSKTGEGSTFSFYVRVEVTPRGMDAVSPEHPIPHRPAHRHSASFSSMSHSRSESRTPTVASSRGVVHTPGLSRYVASPETQSPSFTPSNAPSPSVMSPIGPSESSAPSVRSNSGNVFTTSSISSNIPTPESGLGTGKPNPSTIVDNEPEAVVPQAGRSLPLLQRAHSDTLGTKFGLEQAHPQTYSIVVICPADHARAAIKQHIEHVVPHHIPVNVTALKDIGAFLDLWRNPSPPVFTHIVLDVPASSDIMLFMRQVAAIPTSAVPTLVVVTDYYQKRDIQEDFAALMTAGRKAFLIHKPVKPSVFAMIFDPAQQRNLSKDRVREVNQSSSDDFRKIANQVKQTIGNKSFRLLLVEDSDTNRMVLQRYLRRVGLESDEARDGQECVDIVKRQPQGHYSLIICDIQMPHKNGYEACMEIRQWERDNTLMACPIMALTANAMPEERAAAAAAGFTDYLTKPVDFNRLGQQMMQLLTSNQPHVLLRDQPMEANKAR